MTNINSEVQKALGGYDLWPQLTESSQISNEIQAWTENVEQKNNDKIDENQRRTGKQT